MQKKLTAFFAFAIFVLLVGWAITPAQAHCNGVMEHEDKHKNCPDSGGGGGGGTVPLCVTLTGGKVTPDGSEPYCHGEEVEADPSVSGFFVIAHIANGTGNFVFNASNSDPQVRSIDLDFSACVPDTVLPGNEALCDTREDDFGLFVNDTSFLFATRDFDIRSLGTSDMDNTDSVGLFLRFNVNKQDKTFEQINFRDADGCKGDPVRVERLSEGCWTVESIAPDLGADPVVEGDEACLLKTTGRGRNAPIVVQGKYHMPFFMTLQAFSGNFDVAGVPLDDNDNQLDIAKLENGMCQ